MSLWYACLSRVWADRATRREAGEFSGSTVGGGLDSRPRVARDPLRVLPITWDTVRLFLHVTAATIWVGGQLTLAGLVPGLRALSPDAPRAVARRFNRIAWPAYGVLVVTGIWNILDLDPVWDSDYGRTLMVKITVVVASGVTAVLHARARSKPGLAVFGALTALTALTALLFGVQLG
jgi:putative copper export protein